MGKERWEKALDVYPEAQRGKEEMMNEGEIRIRIWDTEEKKMIYPDTIESSGDYDSLYLNRKGKVMVFDDSDGGKDGLHEHLSCWIAPDRFIPLLSGGRYDKNGKEIYEGDIIKSLSIYIQKEWPAFKEIEKEKREIRWQVIYEMGSFRLVNFSQDKWYAFDTPFLHSMFHSKEFHCFHTRDGWTRDYIKYKDVEVIGNIWENPDLLRKEQEKKGE